MGGEYTDTIVKCERQELNDLFRAIVDQAAWDHGHGGYTGTFAEKHELLIQRGDDWTLETAREHCSEHNDKWGPAFAYHLADGRWYIGGWCSS